MLANALPVVEGAKRTVMGLRKAKNGKRKEKNILGCIFFFDYLCVRTKIVP